MQTSFNTTLTQKEMVFLLILFITRPVEMRKLQWYCSIPLRCHFMAFTGRRIISPLSPSTKSFREREREMNFWKQRSGTNSFCVLSIKLRQEEVGKRVAYYFLECFNLYGRPCNFLTVLDEARATKKHISKIKFLFEDNFRGS